VLDAGPPIVKYGGPTGVLWIQSDIVASSTS
jgi:hypothetical protein